MEDRKGTSEETVIGRQERQVMSKNRERRTEQRLSCFCSESDLRPPCVVVSPTSGVHCGTLYDVSPDMN